MPVIITCECGKKYKVEERQIGKAKCECGKMLTKDEASDAAVEEQAGSDLDAVKKLNDAYTKILEQIQRVIVGQKRVVEEVLNL